MIFVHAHRNAGIFCAVMAACGTVHPGMPYVQPFSESWRMSQTLSSVLVLPTGQAELPGQAVAEPTLAERVDAEFDPAREPPPAAGPESMETNESIASGPAVVSMTDVASASVAAPVSQANLAPASALSFTLSRRSAVAPMPASAALPVPAPAQAEETAPAVVQVALAAVPPMPMAPEAASAPVAAATPVVAPMAVTMPVAAPVKPDLAPTFSAPVARPVPALAMASVSAAAPATAMPSVLAPDTETRFDFVVNNATASQVFLQLGLGTKYNILVPPDLGGKISISLKRTTVPEALEALRELFGYDFRIASGNRVFVSTNAVQTRMFRVNYLPGRRQGSSELRIASMSSKTTTSTTGTTTGATTGTTTGTTTGATSAASSGQSSSGQGGASSSVTSTTDTDFWGDVKKSLDSLIGQEGGRGVTINAAAGVILVRATPAELRQVADFLRVVQVTIERQVMLEAKIVEVRLSKGSETGVNWGLFQSKHTGGAPNGLFGIAPGVSVSAGTLANADGSTVTSASAKAGLKGFYGLSVTAPNFSALLSFLETQGDVQVLSSPRIAALNNQKAVLKVGSDEQFLTYVSGGSTIVTTTGTQTTPPSYAPINVFSGILLDVTPQIDDKGIVMLHVHPAVSSATSVGTADMPSVKLDINETDSMVRVRDGQIVAIGGLMQQRGNANTSGVPGLRDAPVVGGLFRYKSTESMKSELVILIKPTIISDDGMGSSPDEPETPLLSSRGASK